MGQQYKNQRMDLAKRTLIQIFLILFWSLETFPQFIPSSNEEESPISMKLSDDSCNFPSRWNGNWFQSGVAYTIAITNTRIGSMGRCIESDGDKFIVYSQVHECYRCVVFHERHINVLEYKETYCYSDPGGLSLRSLCRQIPGDANLYSMFRLDGLPVTCPFQGSFTFSYNRGYGVCHSPVSTMDSCIQNSQLVLNYQACYDVRGTESRENVYVSCGEVYTHDRHLNYCNFMDNTRKCPHSFISVEEVECFATWKDGSTRYMVGLMKYHRHPSSYEERFRCFAYEKDNRLNYGGRRTSQKNSLDKVAFRVAQSGDATCLGLTPVDGSKTLVLRRVKPVGEPCSFPKWIQSEPKWYSLNRTVSYSFMNSSLSIEMKENNGDDWKFFTSATCSKEIVDTNPMVVGLRSTFVLRSTSECQIGYVCLRTYKRHEDIIEIQMGQLTKYMENACESFNEQDSQFLTLTSKNPKSYPCPFVGQFDITQTISENSPRRCKETVKGSVAMGCSDLKSIQLNLLCSSPKPIYEEHECNGWWEDEGTTYVVTTGATDKNLHCFQIQDRTIELSAQELKRRQLQVVDYETIEIQVPYELSKNYEFIKYDSTCHRKLNEKDASSIFNASDTQICSKGESTMKFHLTWMVTVTLVANTWGFYPELS